MDTEESSEIYSMHGGEYSNINKDVELIMEVELTKGIEYTISELAAHDAIHEEGRLSECLISTAIKKIEIEKSVVREYL